MSANARTGALTQRTIAAIRRHRVGTSEPLESSRVISLRGATMRVFVCVKCVCTAIFRTSHFQLRRSRRLHCDHCTLFGSNCKHACVRLVDVRTYVFQGRREMCVRPVLACTRTHTARHSLIDWHLGRYIRRIESICIIWKCLMYKYVCLCAPRGWMVSIFQKCV